MSEIGYERVSEWTRLLERVTIMLEQTERKRAIWLVNHHQ